jgi:hypothetical protein
MATIYTRATKGSALTWTEGDANITNLNNDKIEDIVEDTTPQLGGNLDVNGNSIVSVSDGNIAIAPNGTGSVVLDGLNWPQSDGTNGQVLTTNGSGQLNFSTVGGATDLNGLSDVTISSPGADQILKYDTLTNQWINAAPSTPSIALDGLSDVTTTTPSNGQALIYNGTTYQWENQNISSGGISNVVEDTTPQLGGSLDVNGQSIVSTSDGNIVLEPNGTGDVYLNADTVRVGDVNANATITTNGTGNLILNTNSGTNSGTISIAQGANGNIQLNPNGTGQSRLIRFAYTSEAVHNIGTTSGTVIVTGSNGNVQTMTLDGNLTLAFTGIGAGYSATLLINTNGTGRTISYSGTWRFAGGEKTLSTTNTTDILSVFFDGSTYWASLSKGFVA